MAEPTDLMIPDDMTASDEVADGVWEQYREAKNYRKQFDKDWERFYKLYASRHWDGFQREWQSTPVINMVASTIQTIVPILTDRKPTLNVAPRQPEYEHMCGVLSSILDFIWEAQECSSKLSMTMVNAMIFGNAFMKVLWDRTACDGKGDVAIEMVDPVHIFISPFSNNIDRSEYVIHAENMRRSIVEQKFAEWMKTDPEGPMEKELTLKRNITSQRDQGAVPPARVPISQITNSGALTGGATEIPDGGNTDELVTVLERWSRKADGTVWQTVVVQDKLVFERPSPFSHGRYPFVHFVDMPHTWTAWATGEVALVEKLQVEINRRRGHIMDILNMTAHPILVVDPAINTGYEDWELYPGLIVAAEGGPAGISWLQPPSIPNALFEVNELDKHDFDIVLGNVDVLQGRRPEGIEAGIAIEMLQEAANVRMRLKVRYMEEAIRKLGELVVAMIQEFYTTERVFMIAGAETGQLEKPMTQDMQALTINQPTGDYGPADESGQQEAILNNAIPSLQDARFDVRVGAGSTLPVSRSTQFQKALTLYSMQILDDVGVMRASGIPRWEEELMRSREYWGMKNAMAMQQEMAMQQGAQGAQAEPTDDDVDEALSGEQTPSEPTSEGE